MVLVSLLQYKRNYVVLDRDFVVRTASRRKDTRADKKGREMKPEYFNAGFYILVPLLLCTFLGFQIDNWLKTKPAFLLMGLAVGIVATFYNLWKLAKE